MGRDYTIIHLSFSAGVLGLPFMSASTVKSLTHLQALCVYSRTYAPGEKPKLETVLEQRVTGVFVHIMIGTRIL